MLVATAVLPEVPVDDPFEDYLLPRWRADQVAVNTIPVHTGPSNDDPTAWNLGQKMGLSGRASLLPLGLFAVRGRLFWLVAPVRPDPTTWIRIFVSVERFPVLANRQ